MTIDMGCVAAQWMSIVLAADELAFLREASALNAEGIESGDGRLDDDLDPAELNAKARVTTRDRHAGLDSAR
jgi:hypothetical protein